MREKRPIRIVVADDHQIVRHGIVSLLSLNKAFQVVGEASDGHSALELAVSLHPDIVLMDISMPGTTGLQATRQIRAKAPTVRVLVLSAYDNAQYVDEILQCGASGYLLKTTTSDELYSAINAVAAGNMFFSPSISRMILKGYLAKEPAPDTEEEPDADISSSPLTSREREILGLIARGKSHLQIAEVLNISVRTVDTHRNNIMKKTNLHDTASLVTYAIRERIVVL